MKTNCTMLITHLIITKSSPTNNSSTIVQYKMYMESACYVSQCKCVKVHSLSQTVKPNSQTIPLRSLKYRYRQLVSILPNSSYGLTSLFHSTDCYLYLKFIGSSYHFGNITLQFLFFYYFFYFKNP